MEKATVWKSVGRAWEVTHPLIKGRLSQPSFRAVFLDALCSSCLLPFSFNKQSNTQLLAVPILRRVSSFLVSTKLHLFWKQRYNPLNTIWYFLIISSLEIYKYIYISRENIYNIYIYMYVSIYNMYIYISQEKIFIYIHIYVHIFIYICLSNIPFSYSYIYPYVLYDYKVVYSVLILYLTILDESHWHRLLF